MNPTRLSVFLTVAGFALLATFGAAACSRAAAKSAKETAIAARLARGEYLVERVGLCYDCHSQRNPDGSFDRSRWLEGATLMFEPTVPMPVWANYAPPIAGLPTLPRDDQAIAFLMEGVKADGSHPRPPMPEFRFERSDAEAAVAYLRSLRNGH
jgi:hypothetical protein